MPDDGLPPPSKHPLGALPIDLDHVTEDLRVRARTELSEDEDKVAHCLKLLRSRLEREEDLRWQDDDLFLLTFLRARKFDVDRAFSLIKGFYTNLGRYGELYYNIDYERLNVVLAANQVDFLPYRDSEGCVIFMYRCGIWDPDATRAEEHVMCTFLSLMQTLRSPASQIAGYQMIADFKNYTTRHLLHTSPSIFKFYISMIQNALPIRMRGFHVVNQNHLFSYIWAVAKLFLSKKLRERVHFHGSDLSSLHKFLHPSVLPQDLGGELPPHNTEWREKFRASTDYMKHVLSFGYERHLRKDWRKESQSR